uniref:GK21472 n=1 Tax=Drosophila willistoni TaxID=7260 RepID=B4MQ78_DROWI
MMDRFGALLIWILFGILDWHSMAEGTDCSKPPDFSTLQTCCASPTMTFEAFKSQCGKYMPAGSPRLSPCLYECIFNASNTLDGTEINVQNARNMMQKILGNNQGFTDAYTEGLENCSNFVDEMMKYSRRRPPALPGVEVCSSLPVLFAMCSQKYVFVHCPPASWTNSDACEHSKEYSLNCQSTKQSRGGSSHRVG